MFKYILFFTLIFGALFSFFPTTSLNEPPELFLKWYLDIEGNGAVTLPRPPEWKAPFNAILREIAGGERALVFPDRAQEPLPADSLVWAPLYGTGYFEYFKVGKEISFRESSRGEVLWKKTFFSYPVSDHYGNLILLLTGDSSRVDVLDPSGNPAGVGSVSGNILTDYDFAARESRALVVFSGGQSTILDKNGTALFRYLIETDERPFLIKSCALSPDGLLAAIHYQAGTQDRVRLIEKGSEPGETRVTGEAVLPAIYPHLLHMAVNKHGLLVAAPDFTGFFDADGDAVWNRPLAPAAGRVFRPVYADREFFVFGENAFVFVLDASGRMIAVLPVQDRRRPYQVLPGPEEGAFVLQAEPGLHVYRFSPRVK